MFWTKINTSDNNTLPPMNKRVFWYRSSLACRNAPYHVFAMAKQDGDCIWVDGTLLDDGDYWIDIPDPV